MPANDRREGTETVRSALLFRIRLVVSFFMLGLFLSGVTAFPLLAELNLLSKLLHANELATSGGSFAALGGWIVRVRDGLDTTYAAFPFIAYGTDWLAFGHLIIALFFVGPFLDPVRNVFILRAGLLACGLVLPLALICGPIRGIPFFWRLIDCSFGISAFPLLWYCLRLTRRLERMPVVTAPSDGR